MTHLTAYNIYKVFLSPLLDYFVSAGVAWCIPRWRNMSNMKGLKREHHRVWQENGITCWLDQTTHQVARTCLPLLYNFLKDLWSQNCFIVLRFTHNNKTGNSEFNHSVVLPAVRSEMTGKSIEQQGRRNVLQWAPGFFKAVETFTSVQRDFLDIYYFVICLLYPIWPLFSFFSFLFLFI